LYVPFFQTLQTDEKNNATDNIMLVTTHQSRSLLIAVLSLCQRRVRKFINGIGTTSSKKTTALSFQTGSG